jgi:acyltransferase
MWRGICSILHFDIFNPMKGRVVGWNYLFLHEAVTLYGFYLLGIYLRRKRFFSDLAPLKWLLPGAVAAFLIVLFTYKLNTGPFSFHYFNAVVILFASHGNMLLFPLTAIAGCAMVLLLAGMTRKQGVIVWLGQNTLILMCLNGVFYHYLNSPTAKWILANLTQSGLGIFAASLAMTVVSLILCIPLVWVFTKFVPQLVGKPKVDGPLLKNLL